MITQQRFLHWCENVSDERLKAQLLTLNDEQIHDAFYKQLSFGTGGLRGILGVGTNCMNIYTVDKATQGICNVLVEKHSKTVVVCYDSRNNSLLFARNTAEVFASNGIKVYMADDIMPISFLSYCIRQLSADAGIMITASHNPAVYNGYKVYDNSGCQCTDDSARVYAQSIEKVDEFAVTHVDFDLAVSQGRIVYLPQKLRYEYIQTVLSLDYYPLQGLNVVYSPLYGAGYRVIPEVLTQKGANVNMVEEQSHPNGDFPTCPYPNPEKREALTLALAEAKRRNAPLLVATDPDCDRVGIAVLHNGEYVCLSGNEVGALLTDFVLQGKKTPSTIYKTIVTSDLGAKIALNYGANVKEVLTGFKYIGEQIGLLEKEDLLSSFALGYEESYGYLLCPEFRDKDGVGSCYVICQMVNYYLSQGKTLVDRINQLYAQYGRFWHKLLSYEFGGAVGSAKMHDIIADLRANKIASVCGRQVDNYIDYRYDNTSLPPADVLSYAFEGGKLIIRPSGTEPLIKAYLTAVGEDGEGLLNQMTAMLEQLFR